ncbi:hypothetical protein CDD80_4259 [Ophiocordyceps camponoti-rufipedis]|uniref:Uncharacterized protein n=1 Tax=Ophiocordyceps camponoti-rufipedis TaxID=2004952 RepID=A0A2C5YTD6_9HYPO|nr:hypothetical protein CDD80_4259 [Ophiocordyceps camponoti-rufipedis]
MDGARVEEDPFLWDPDAVARHLCALKPPCAADATTLATTVAEAGISGEVLLTYDLVVLRGSISLQDILGVKTGLQQWSLGSAITKLRCNSPGYHQWKEALRGPGEHSKDALRGPGEHSREFLSPKSRPVTPTRRQQTSEAAKRKVDELSVPPTDAKASDSTSLAVEADIIPPTPPHNDAATTPSTPQRPSKRKRVAPVRLVAKCKEDNAYLGRVVMAKTDVLAPDRLFPIPTRTVETETSFATLYPFKVPPGWRHVIARTMKRHLLKNGRRETLLLQGLVPALSFSSEDSDKIIDLDDIRSSVDTETLEQMKLEDAEILREAQMNPVLATDKVLALLQDELAKLKAAWEEKKLPRYRRKAYKLWTTATKKGTKTIQILQARQAIKKISQRLQNLKNEVVDLKFTKESEVKNQALSLQQTLEDKLYQEWLAQMLESRGEPPKPESLPRLKRLQNKELRLPNGDEILSSSEEDDFIVSDEDDFMTPDDNMPPLDADKVVDDVVSGPVARDGKDMLKSEDRTTENSPVTPSKADLSLFVDLTQVETPASLRRLSRQDSIIDLTTPTVARSLSRVPSRCVDEEGDIFLSDAPQTSADCLEAVEAIGNQKPKHWADLMDRLRLILCLVWRLPHARRSHVLAATREHDADELFELSVTKQLSEPLQDENILHNEGHEATAFDLTRLLLCYIKIKHCKEQRVMSLSAADSKRLQSARENPWIDFLTLLKSHAHLFPQDSQIYRTNDLEDDDFGALDDDGLPGSQESPSQSRKNAPKEIVQNREAVDLRERENRRVEEQEARRVKLRATLDVSGFMSSDKSRLIINESKTEDQAFIYVNEAIGARIKDHQIEGVRFMWNQIVTDANTSRGCLLAHTMGLGKTMQVITLLVAIQESSKSSEPAVSSQIPQDLRDSKTLVLCPAGLVDNWMDELLLWAPAGMLGPIRKIESRLAPEERRSAIFSWADKGGVLVLGYNMLQKIISDNKLESKIMEEPNIVIADEAHTLKNPKSQVHNACAGFKTKCRIALTGSPMANNVEEYYTMISWVAPNFLGPLKEFQDIYATPIQQGMYKDSSSWEKRKALRQLKVLNITVAPKVNRHTTKMAAKDSLPPKQEFVLCVPPTAMQRKLYNMYLNNVASTGGNTSDSRFLPIVDILGLVVNHPSCFRSKMLAARDKHQLHRDTGTIAIPEALISPVLKETNGPDLGNSNMSVKTELLTIVLDEARALGDKVLVFSHSIQTLDYLDNLLKLQKRQVYRLDGKVAIEKRQELVKRFNSGNQEVYLISTKTGGVGLNIQGANRVVIFDFRWSPMHEQQAVGRAYRIGQKKPVFVYRFVTAGTFEDDVHNRQVFKTQLASRVVDKKNPLSWSKKNSNKLHEVEDVEAESLSDFVGKDSILDALIGHKPNGEAIRRIVSTDTFEEEDPDDGLTAQEQRQAEDEAKMNHLRLTDPAEFERLRIQQQTAAFQEAAARHAQRSSTDQSFSAAGQSGQITTTAWAPMASNAPARTPGGLTMAPAPLPLAGANTFFGEKGHGATVHEAVPAFAARLKESALGSSDPSNPTRLFVTPGRSAAQMAFHDTLSRSIKKIDANDMRPSMIAEKVTSAIEYIRREQHLGFPVDDQHWTLLVDFLNNARFGVSIASGHLTPAYLAHTNKAELERRVTALNQMTQDEFGRLMQESWEQREPDPSV